jgi:CRISPR-associated endoribonuclease Cas6
LKIPKFESESDSLKVISADVNLNLGMLSDEPYENTILNIFRNKRLKIDSDGHSAEFRIVDIKKEESPDFSGIVRFRTISPLVITQKVVFNGYESNYYMKPEDADYAEHFKNVLIMKYKNYIKNSGKFKLAQKSSGSIPIQHFKIKGPVKSRLISIERKGVTVNKIRGFQYAFEISGDKDLLKFAYETGFGNYGGWGMGCVAKEENHSPDFNSVKEFPLEYNKSYDSLYK